MQVDQPAIESNATCTSAPTLSHAPVRRLSPLAKTTDPGRTLTQGEDRRNEPAEESGGQPNSGSREPAANKANLV